MILKGTDMNIKDYREKELKAFIIGNILVIMVVSGIVNMNSVLGVSDSKDVMTEVFKNLFSGGMVSSIFYSFYIVFDCLVPSEWKAILSNLFRPLEGELIFDDIKKQKHKDRRFTTKDALNKYCNVYQDLEAETNQAKRRKISNSAWYKVYVKYQENKKIEILQRDYLLCRDMNIATLWTIIFYCIMIAVGISAIDWRTIMLLLIEISLTLLATNNKQRRFVYTIIASDISDVSNENKENK